MAEVIGFLSSVLGIISFAQDNFATDPSASTIRVQVGLDGTPGDSSGTALDGADGAVPHITCYDNVGNKLGQNTDGGYIDIGSYADVKVYQDDNRQATYSLITAQNDAVCIASLAMTWVDESKYGWVGDWSKQCGKTWYPSGIYIDNQALNCGWIDADGTSGPETAFSLHWPDFNDKGNGYNSDPNWYCTNTPVLNYYTQGGYGDNDETIPIWGAPQKREIQEASLPKKNSIAYARRNGSSKFENESRLVKSHMPEHSAVELCDHANSFGPDFWAVEEGMYCDMGTKTLYHVCTSKVDKNCFDGRTQKVRGGAGKVKRDPGYTKTVEWHGRRM